MLGESCPHQQPAVAAADDSKVSASGPAGSEQQARAGRKIVVIVLLLGEIAVEVPCFAKLAASANVRHRQNATVLQPEELGTDETRRRRKAVAAVSGEDRGRGAVVNGAFLVEYRHRQDRK